MLKVAELEQRLAEAHAMRERDIARAQLSRSGHVYVISNVGSFGEHLYKIGMTRRLDPMERAKELGDASVPFSFDVHAIIYTDDAPSLEAKLHHAFARRRVNRVNERREFFRVTLGEIEREVRAGGADIEFTRSAEAADYRKTLALLQHEVSDAEIDNDEAYQAPSFLELLRREARADASMHEVPELDALTTALPLAQATACPPSPRSVRRVPSPCLDAAPVDIRPDMLADLRLVAMPYHACPAARHGSSVPDSRAPRHGPHHG